MIAVVIPIYLCDRSLYPLVERCLDAVIDLRKTHNPLIVIDDASPLPWSHEYALPNSTRFDNQKNLGFTATVNRGLEQAFKHSITSVVVVMNDDIILTQECFDRFRKLEGLVIASPRDTASSPDDRFGACWAMTRETYELLGPLNEKYRNYFSDVDYYNRAKEAGVKIEKWSDIILDHPESSTFKLLDKEKLLADDAKIFNG